MLHKKNQRIEKQRSPRSQGILYSYSRIAFAEGRIRNQGLALHGDE